MAQEPENEVKIPKGALKRAFCEHYAVSRIGSKAAIAAGYSEKTAKQKAYELLQDPEIKAYIAFLEAEKIAEANVSKEDLILELKKIGFSDIADFVDVRDQSISFKDFAEMPKGATSVIAEVSETTGKYGSSFKFKLHPKLDAIRQMAEMLGYKATEKKEIFIQDSAIDKTNFSIKTRAPEIE